MYKGDASELGEIESGTSTFLQLKEWNIKDVLTCPDAEPLSGPLQTEIVKDTGRLSCGQH